MTDKTKVVPNSLREVIESGGDIYAEIDKRNGWQEPLVDNLKIHAADVFLIFGELWGDVLKWCYAPKNSRLVGMRLKAVIYCVRPDIFGGKTLEEIGKADGITKSTVQDLTAKFRDQFKTRCRAMRSDESREKMRGAALKRRGKPA